MWRWGILDTWKSGMAWIWYSPWEKIRIKSVKDMPHHHLEQHRYQNHPIFGVGKLEEWNAKEGQDIRGKQSQWTHRPLLKLYGNDTLEKPINNKYGPKMNAPHEEPLLSPSALRVKRKNKNEMHHNCNIREHTQKHMQTLVWETIIKTRSGGKASCQGDMVTMKIV